MAEYRSLFSRDDYSWPSGLPRAAALFNTWPQEVTHRTGIAFESGVDDLDYYRAAGVELPSGRRIILLWHERAPVLGLELLIDLADEPDAARTETMAALEFGPADVLWVPDPSPPAS